MINKKVRTIVRIYERKNRVSVKIGKFERYYMLKIHDYKKLFMSQTLLLKYLEQSI